MSFITMILAEKEKHNHPEVVPLAAYIRADPTWPKRANYNEAKHHLAANGAAYKLRFALDHAHERWRRRKRGNEGALRR